VQPSDVAALLRSHAADHGVPGAAAGIVQNGHEIVACCGVADVRTREPVTPATRFGIGSLTKSLVATEIARLADEGRLSYDDCVAAHVPELRWSGWAAIMPPPENGSCSTN